MSPPGRRLLALIAAVMLVSCSGGGNRDEGLRFVELPDPPRKIGATTPIVENADTVIALVDGRLFRYDPWEEKAIWLELGRDLSSAKSRLVSWNDRVWYLTTDRGRLELASVALSGEQRADTRAVTGATDTPFAIVAARDGVYVFGADGGFRVDREGIYTSLPAPPLRDAVPDWSQARIAALDDGSIALTTGNRVRWVFEPDVAQWREPTTTVSDLDIRSVSVASDGLYLVVGAPPQVVRVAALNRVEPVATPLSPECAASTVYVTDVGPMAVGCGKARMVEAGTTREIDVPSGTSVLRGPRGRPLAVASNGELSLLQ